MERDYINWDCLFRWTGNPLPRTPAAEIVEPVGFEGVLTHLRFGEGGPNTRLVRGQGQRSCKQYLWASAECTCPQTSAYNEVSTEQLT